MTAGPARALFRKIVRLGKKRGRNIIFKTRKMGHSGRKRRDISEVEVGSKA